MKEVYVSFEVAKLLKEKGFDWECAKYYNAQHDEARIVGDTFICNWNDESLMERLMMSGAYSIPTQQMAVSWLMEEKHIFIGKSFAKNEETLNLEFYSPIFNMNTGELITTIGAFCPEDAVEAALEYALTKFDLNYE